MPRSRASELPQRPSPRAPHSLWTSSSSDSDPVHQRSRTTERSPRLSDGRSPRSEPLNQRKLGSRIADLETQLGQAQGELKCLKDQLASAEAAKRAAQELLDKKSRKPNKLPNSLEIQDKKQSNEEYYDDVFEVPVEKPALEFKESPATPAPDSLFSCDELASKNEEISTLKGKLDEKSKEAHVLAEENAKMKWQLHEKSTKISSAESEIEEQSLRLKQADDEIQKSRTSAARAKAELENEMKMLRVQTEQWRKAADAAATVLAGEVEMNGRRISERCGSMDKQLYGSSFEPVGRYTGSPGLPDDSDDVYGGGKRRGSGIKMFGDLWRKRGNK
ncbi:interactor of constitutive active ROPs 4-like [Salvia miltiorrhiza]|uniref:interactor of constitutive active ROPs 4-like n=1 Tax=Salvia miltiorrhiza TaxID=226208 RepID=UPI0025AB847B|nr:interactor of constitutive active ROPs 4-like [Salvia miltiorrhiza]